MKRIFLFVVTNLAVLAILGVIVRIFGLDRMLEGNGFNVPVLFGFAAVYGFGGSLISLFLSKWMAKFSTGAKVIDSPQNELQAWLVGTVERHARKAGIGMPEVAIYDSPDPNAFATGASRNHALVAVSTGLVDHMSRDEVDAVLGHEISHVANGDMVTLALLQGVLNTFVIFLSRALAFAIDMALRRGEDDRRSSGGPVYFITVIVLQIVLGILASMIVMWFSRYREFRADRGGAQLAGRDRMIAALQRLRQGEQAELPKSLAAFGISGGVSRGFMNLFRSHPPLEERIEALAS